MHKEALALRRGHRGWVHGVIGLIGVLAGAAMGRAAAGPLALPAASAVHCGVTLAAGAALPEAGAAAPAGAVAGVASEAGTDADAGAGAGAPPARPALPWGEKFRLGRALCGVALAGPAGRQAAQLALYQTPSLAGVSAAPRVGTGGLAGGAADVPLPAAAARPAWPSMGRADAATVVRVRALMPAMDAAARQYGLDPLLLHAVAYVESRHQPQALSPAGARGVMQVMPATARRFGLREPARELLRAEDNVAVGAAYLKTLTQRFAGDLRLVVAAYNAGEGAVERHGRRVPPYPETQAYVRDVLALYGHLRARLGGAAGGPVAGRADAPAGGARW